MKYTYHIETYHDGKWIKIVEDSRDFCNGWLHSRIAHAPRPAYQLVRSDGKILREHPARYEVNIGQVAGWPTAEQYERAGKDALARAELLRTRRDHGIGGQ